MSKFRLLATALLVALCTGFYSCGGDDDISTTSNEGGNSSITGTTAKVDLKKAGSLSTLISDDAKFNITDLTITGDINGDDIALIREMAGADMNGDETKGHLSVLNLKDANIVAGGNPYYVKSTTEACYSKKDIVGSYMFANCKLTNVILPSNATEIKNNIFYKTGIEGYSVDNTTLKSIIIGDKVTIINYGAFSSCTKLAEVVIPNSVIQIGSYAFSRCTSLAKVIIPNNLWNIEDYVFSGCSNLTKVENLVNISRIGRYAFSDCTNLTIFTIPASMVQINDGAFSGCNMKEFIVSEDNYYYSSLDGVLFNKDKSQLLIYPIAKPSTSYVIPNSVTTIEKNAFSDCKLTSITIGDKITNIADAGFNNYLTEYRVSEGNDNYSSFEGVLFNKDKTKLVAYPKAKTNSSYTIPNSVSEVENYAFRGCPNLTTLNLNNVTRIGTSMFVGSHIRSFIVSDSNSKYSAINGVLFNKEQTSLIIYPMVLMKDYAPNGVGSKYIIPNGVETIFSYAFFPYGELTNVDDYTSYKYYPLETLTIPASVNNIGSDALVGVLNIHCKGEVPPSLSSNQYPLISKNVYVPMSAVNAYKQANGWKDNNIIGK